MAMKKPKLFNPEEPVKLKYVGVSELGDELPAVIQTRHFEHAFSLKRGEKSQTTTRQAAVHVIAASKTWPIFKDATAHLKKIIDNQQNSKGLENFLTGLDLDNGTFLTIVAMVDADEKPQQGQQNGNQGGK